MKSSTITKPFVNMFGKPVQLTKDEFVNKWLHQANQLYDIFNDTNMGREYIDVQVAIQRAAEAFWDLEK